MASDGNLEETEIEMASINNGYDTDDRNSISDVDNDNVKAVGIEIPKDYMGGLNGGVEEVDIAKV